MLISVNRQLRRHRRQALTTLAVLAVAFAAMSAHAVLMSGGMHEHGIGGAATTCLAIGGSLAIAGAAAFAVRRLMQRPLWLIPVPLAPALPFVPSSTGFLVRAGPPPLLQVFRF